jgi:hypothetical protein
VFADSQSALENVAAAAWTDLAHSGAKIVRETLALKPAFLSMIPGNERLRPHSGYTTSKNQASFAPMFAYPAGPERGRWAGTVIRFHWHQDDVGNTLVTGETGSGKTTLVAFLLAMTAARARLIALDHKRGWNLLFHAMGAPYGAGQRQAQLRAAEVALGYARRPRLPLRTDPRLHPERSRARVNAGSGSTARARPPDGDVTMPAGWRGCWSNSVRRSCICPIRARRRPTMWTA